MSSNMPSKFMDSFCTPSRKKRRRYFGHDPDKNVPVTVDLSAQREEISRVPMQDLNHEEDKILHLIVKFGLNQVLKLYSILQTIPKNFPNRLKYFVRISKFITGLDMVPENIVHKVGTILDESNLPLCNVEDVLWSASHGLKMPVVVFLSPKADTCIIEGCDGTLYGAEKEVTNVTLFTMNGPVPGLKTNLSCKECGARYGIDKYRPRGEEAKYYPDDYRPTIVSASNKVYFTEDLFEFMCESGNHGFVSSQAFSQTYIAVFHADHAATRRFCGWKDATFGSDTAEKDSGFDTGSSSDENVKAQTSTNPRGSTIPNPFMSRKNATEATFNGELEREVRERKMVAEVGFKNDGCRENVMQFIDEMRRTELYPHPPEGCNKDCQNKGCQNLRVIDSCWKLCIPHCLLAVETEVEGFPLLNFPNVCSKEPKAGSVFCVEHHKLLQRHSVPTDKSDFLKYIGCKENPQSQDDIRKVDEKVISFMKNLVGNDRTALCLGTSATSYQGTESLIKKIPVDTLNDEQTTDKCNKDTGEKGKLRQRARGHFAAVSGGGNIICFNPIYKSESPSQIFMLTIQMIHEEVKNIPESEQDNFLENYILSYDNMCNLDKIKAAKVELPLPGKLKDLWQKIRKIIDRLHIRNHKNKCCQQQYHPDIVLKAEERQMNTMAAEQLFSWMSRFKKIVNSMTQTHHLFYLHRMCKRRNRYTAMCRRRGVEPVHPGVNVKLP